MRTGRAANGCEPAHARKASLPMTPHSSLLMLPRWILLLAGLDLWSTLAVGAFGRPFLTQAELAGGIASTVAGWVALSLVVGLLEALLPRSWPALWWPALAFVVPGWHVLAAAWDLPGSSPVSATSLPLLAALAITGSAGVMGILGMSSGARRRSPGGLAPLGVGLAVAMVWLPRVGSAPSWLTPASALPLLLLIVGAGSRRLDACYTLFAAACIPAALILADGRDGHLPHGTGQSVRPGHGVVLLSIDALRRDALGVHGASPDATPTLDSLALAGLVFDQAISASPWTAASMAAMLTGLPPAALGMSGRSARFARSVTTMASCAREAGAATAAFVCNPFLSKANGFAQGFDAFRQFPPPLRREPLGMWLWRGVARRPASATGEAFELVNLAARWLASLDDGCPFLLWIHFLEPHQPYVPHYPAGITLAALYPHLRGGLLVPIRTGTLTPSLRERDAVRGLYADEVRYADAAAGHLMDVLRREKLSQRTTVVVTSDHGEEFWEHGGYEHGHTMYDELLRVPLVVVPPAERARFAGGTWIADLVSTGCVAPTVLDVLGAAVPSQMRYPSLASFWREGQPPLDLPPWVVSDGMYYFGPGRAVRTATEKYIEWPGRDVRLLFDLEADPLEAASLMDRSPERASRALAILAREDSLVRSPVDDTARASTTEEWDQLPMLKALGYVQ